MRQHSRFQIFDGTMSATQNSVVFETYGCRGLLLLLDVTAVAGGGTLDAKVQLEVPNVTLVYYDLDGAAFTQTGAAATKVLEVYPALTESANKKVSAVLPSRWRIAFTIGGTSVTFRLTGEVLW